MVGGPWNSVDDPDCPTCSGTIGVTRGNNNGAGRLRVAKKNSTGRNADTATNAANASACTVMDKAVATCLRWPLLCAFDSRRDSANIVHLGSSPIDTEARRLCGNY